MKLLWLSLAVLFTATCSEASGKTFKVYSSSSKKNYRGWQETCQNHGGRLASINSAQEQEMAEAALKSTSSNSVMTGMKRIAPRSVRFINGDGETLRYTHWNRGEPNDLGNEPCVEMYTIKRFFGKWNDIKCSGYALNAGLCEFAPKTYSVVDNGGHSQTDAQWRAKCESRGGQLARIDSAEEQEAAFRVIKTAQKHSVLIDAKRKSPHSAIFQNSDGVAISYKNWNKGEPNNFWEQCTEVYGRSAAAGKWNDISCKIVKAALCESRKFGRSIRYIVLENSGEISYDAWEKKCQAKGGHLASIRDGEEQTAAEAALRGTRRHSALTGMKRKSPHSKTFVDTYSYVMTYSHWNKGEPNDWGSGEECVEVYKSHSFGRWNDIRCKRNTALCEVA